MRSQSGSVAMHDVGAVLLRQRDRQASASAFSGIRRFHGGEAAVEVVLLGHESTVEAERRSIGRVITPPVPWIGVKTIFRSRADAPTSRVEHQRLQALHVGLVDFAADA